MGVLGHKKINMKTVYTLNINNYRPELCKLTIPTIQAYAKKINANFEIITERQYPEWPITYEKIQIYELGHNNEWNIFIDADTIIAPELDDMTKIIKTDHIGVHMAYDADKTLPIDHYFIQDKRNIGIVTNFVISHHDCHRIWTPFDESRENALRRLKQVKAWPHIIDELCMSRNLARYGLHFTGIIPFSYDRFIHLSATVEDKNTINKAKDFLVLHANNNEPK